MNRPTLDELARRWRQAVYGRELFFAAGAACLAAAVVLVRPTLGWAWCAVSLAVVLAARLAFSRPWRIDAARIARHLDRTRPEMEESGALFLKSPADLTLLERLQVRRVEAVVDPGAAGRRELGGFGMPPRRFLDATIFWLAALLVLGVTALWFRGRPAAGEQAPRAGNATASRPTALPTPPAPPAWPRIVGGGLVVTPPAYTGRPPRRVDGFNAEVEAGATVAWTLTLDRPVRAARLVFGEGATGALALAARPNGAPLEFSGTRLVTETGLYHLAAVLPDGTAWNPPEVFALKVIPDLPPVLRIVQPAPARTEVAPTAPPAAPAHVMVEVEASDDYGLVDARIVATVAKGSGEAVKFREQPLAFDGDAPDPLQATPRVLRLTRTLDLGALGMEPGDELYFFIEAHDNRQPTANRTRSETRFITLRGPQEKTAATGRGVTGINLVPQYFRSERQIIIDTEKLIADRPAIPDHDFRERANGLGIDQQLLRLRYGQLLGEELENSSGDHAEVALDPLQRAAPQQPAGPRAAASITQRFLQEHEEQDREGGTDEQREAGARPDHPDQPLSAGEVVAPFVDQHDSQDKSTYYDTSAKGTMRDALAAMWDAEKYLRTARPEEALAPAHRALEILKDLQQSARAYVQHVGFEAPPLKIAQRRLTGDVSDVPPRGSVGDVLAPADPAAQAARAALATLPTDAGTTPEARTLASLRQVEPALTAAAARQPEVFLPGLQALRRVTAEGPLAAGDPEQYPVLRRALLRLLPPALPLPERGTEAAPALAGSYYRALAAAPAAPEARP